MRLTIAIILIAFLSSVTEFFLPWWSIAPVAFIVSWVLGLKGAQMFLSGFLGIALFWAPSMIFRDIANEHILSSRMAILFFKKPNYPLFITVCTLVGSLIGGLASLSGSLLRTKDRTPASS